MAVTPLDAHFGCALPTNAHAHDLLRKLQKALKSMDKLVQEFKEAVDDAAPWVATFSNVAEQISCCQRAKENILDRQFPEIRAGVLRKLQASADTSTVKITSALRTIDGICQEARKVTDTSMRAYARTAQVMPVTSAAKATVTWPSVSDILLWLRCLSDLMTEDLLQREYLMASLPWRSCEERELLSTMWTLPSDLLNYAQDVFGYSRYFIEATL